MTAHLTHDPDGEPATTDDPGWLELSAALGDHACLHADRDDLIVTVAPGAGKGAPACFHPTTATIELDAKHWNAANLAGTDLDDPADRARYAAAWGLLVHECAHAAHSTWTPADAPEDAPGAVVQAAFGLEESRIEAQQVRRRPDDRTWLRASASTLILNDITKAIGDGEPMTGAEAASAAALILARTDAGILEPTETAPVAKAAEQALGDEVVDALRGIWTDAHTTADHDIEAMLELGKRWVDTLDAHGIGDTELDQALADALAQAIAEAVEAIEKAVDAELPQPVPVIGGGGDEEPDPREQAAHDVFEDEPRRGGRKVRIRTRTPKPAERAAARTLGRVLTTAGVPERTAVKTTSATPPGRLRMRGALARDAQQAAGATPTAEPFVRTKRSLSPAPPLKVGIACDISGSMDDYARPVASAAWILANAAKHTNVEATTATVVFGDHVKAITRPGIPPTMVTDFAADHGWEEPATAIDALDGALGLSKPGAARLLVVISDGHYYGSHRHRPDAQQRIDRLRATGCGVLWLAPDTDSKPLDGATTLILDDPAGTARAIGKAATAALRSSR